MKMLIGGKPVDGLDGSLLNIINPATSQVIDTVPNASREDVDRAVVIARKAQKQWARVPVYQRAEILKTFLSLVDQEKENLAQLLMSETGKPIYEARNEIANIPVAFNAFIEKAKHLYGDMIPNGLEAGQEKNLQFTQREPLGVIVCILPFNFPVDMFDHKVAPSLLAGNAVIVKPPHQNPLTVCRVAELLIKAGVGDGVIQVVTGEGPKTGSALVSHPGIDKITFTGSTAVGIEIAKAAAANLAHVSLELGGNDAFIVHEDADLDLVANEMTWGRMYNCGQICCASKRFLVHHQVKDKLLAKVIENVNALVLGSPEDENTQVACLISEEAAKKVEAQIKKTVEQGGKIVLGGKRTGAYLQPTILVDVPKDADVAKDMEIFGPVIPIIGFDTLEEAVEIANSSMYGLGSCIFSSNMKTTMNVASQLECGLVVINGSSSYRSFEMPFGGYKKSGIGNEGVLSTFYAVTRLKTVVLKNIFD